MEQMAFVVNHLCDLMPGTTEQALAVAPLSHGAGIHLLTQVARAALPSAGVHALRRRGDLAAGEGAIG